MTKKELLSRLARYPDDSEIVVEWPTTSREDSNCISISKNPSDDLAWEQKHSNFYKPDGHAIYIQAW